MASDAPGETGDDGARGVVKSPQNLGAGLFLIVIAAIAAVGSWELKFGQMRGIGPAMMPRVTAALVAMFGIALVFSAFTTHGPRMERWPLRGPFFVLGSVLLFALTIRGAEFFGFKMPPLGLLVAGPLVVIFSSFADATTRWVEVLIYSVVITAFCAGLFKYALRLPIPLAPWLLGY